MSIDLDDLARDAVAAPPTQVPDLDTLRKRVEQRRRNRRILTGVIAGPVVALAAIGAWVVIDRDDEPSQVIAAGDADTTPGTAAAPGVTPGEFVWPAPPRDFTTLDDMTEQFVVDVLGWQPDRVRQDGGTDDNGPQSFTLVNLDTNRELHVLAIPSPMGWGFIQIGDPGISIGETATGGFAIRFQTPPGTTDNIVEIRYLDGDIITDTTTGSELPLPSNRSPESVVSVLITHADASGTVITASGGQFTVRGDEIPPASGEFTTVAVPDLVGLTVDEANAMLAELGLAGDLVESAAPGVAARTVVATEPAPGSQVDAGTTITLTVAAAPSQSAADAARDQVVPELAALPASVRVQPLDELFGPTRTETAEGTWIISQPDADAIDDLTNGCILGNPAGIYGRDQVCLSEYTEILLLDSRSGDIIRAYPFPGIAPRTLQATADAVYCIRQGDGGLPDSMLCRIDLTTLDATVRVFPSALDSAFSPGLDRWVPSSWTVDEPTDLALWEHLDATDTSITISGWSGIAVVDPATLELLTIDQASS